MTACRHGLLKYSLIYMMYATQGDKVPTPVTRSFLQCRPFMMKIVHMGMNQRYGGPAETVLVESMVALTGCFQNV